MKIQPMKPRIAAISLMEISRTPSNAYINEDKSHVNVQQSVHID